MTNRKIAYAAATLITLLGATAVIAGTGFLAAPEPTGCAADQSRSAVRARETLLSDAPVAIAGNQLVDAATGQPLEPDACAAIPDGMLRHLATLPGTGAAYVVDQAGQDVLALVDTDGVAAIASASEISHPTWSPAGRLAWSENLQVLKLMSPDGADVTAVVLPRGGVAAFSPIFLEEDRLMAVVQEHIKGAPPEDESLNNLWSFDIEQDRWTRLTDFAVTGTRWSAIRTPVAAPDGSIAFVRVHADATKTSEPAYELWRTTTDDGVTKVRDLPGEMYLAGVSDDRFVWNVPSRSCGDWGLFTGSPDSLDEVGCGSVMTDPLAIADPDLLVDEHGHEAPGAGGGDDPADLVIVIGDFSSPDEAAGVLGQIGRSGRVIGHRQARTIVRPGAWVVVAELSGGLSADEQLDAVRSELDGCGCGAWLSPDI